MIFYPKFHWHCGGLARIPGVHHVYQNVCAPLVCFLFKCVLICPLFLEGVFIVYCVSLLLPVFTTDFATTGSLTLQIASMANKTLLITCNLELPVNNNDHSDP